MRRICIADSTCLSLLVVTQLFSDLDGLRELNQRKQILTRNSHSRSFEVKEFGITEKPTTDCISPYHNSGLISKMSEKIESENAKNCRCRQPHRRLTPPPGGTSANIRTSLIRSETRVIGLHICCRQYGSIFIQFFLWWAPKDVSFCNRVRIGRSRFSKVVDCSTDRKGVGDFLLVVVSAYRYIAITTLAITAVFLVYLRQFLIDLHQIYRHSSVPKNTSP